MKSNKEKNELFPVFLKLNELSILMVGGGHVALEKLTAILSNSPKTKITILAKTISQSIKDLKNEFPSITLIEREYSHYYIMKHQIIISAVNDIDLSKRIKEDAKNAGILCNSADKPDLCDFYLGSIVQKGNLKIAISTNGKSPTFAKRFKEIINEILPEEIDEVIENLNEIRNSLKGDFEYKVKKLDEITKNYQLN